MLTGEGGSNGDDIDAFQSHGEDKAIVVIRMFSDEIYATGSSGDDLWLVPEKALKVGGDRVGGDTALL